MTIHETIKGSIPEALRAHDEVWLRTLRSLTTAMTNELIAKKHKPTEILGDDDAIAVLKRAMNQRKDSIEQFRKASRPDLAEKEEAEITIIATYLPAQMSREEIMVIAKAKMADLGVVTKGDSGKLTGLVMKECKNRADGGEVKSVVDELLAQL